MPEASIQEQSLVTQLYVEILPELKEVLGRAADSENIPLNHLVARLLAKAMKRPELGVIPRKKMGRPRKQLSK